MGKGVTAIIKADFKVSDDKFILEGVDVSEPTFTISEIAKIFWARTSHWIRWREREGFFVLDGEPVGTTRGGGGVRIYNLADVEKMSHALAVKKAIDGSQLNSALRTVHAIAKVWGYID